MKKIVMQIFFVAVSLFLCGCERYRESGQKPDDEISRVVWERTGENFHYRGKQEYTGDEVEYEYQIKKKDKAAIANL